MIFLGKGVVNLFKGADIEYKSESINGCIDVWRVSGK